jgi:hypothetical protein
MKTQTQTSKTLLEQSVEGMLWSKVDMETSDIFFNFGTPLYNKYFGSKEGYQAALLEDAINFLEIVERQSITPQDLVDDFNKRL